MGEEVVVKQLTRVPGGKAGNVAVAASRLLGPNHVAILGGLGKDSIASDQMRIFELDGVVTSGLKFTSDHESGQAYIVIDERGENIIHTYFGANASVEPEDLDEPGRRSLIAKAQVIALIDPPFETALRLAQKGKKLKKLVAWDPGVISQLALQKVKPLLENVDYVVANEVEIHNLSKTTDIDAAANLLNQVNSELKIITKLGARGCLMHSGKVRKEFDALDLMSLGMKVVNTVGCGDAFLGAFVAALSEGRSDSEAVRWGCCAGGLKATSVETRGSPNRKTLFKYLISA